MDSSFHALDSGICCGVYHSQPKAPRPYCSHPDRGCFFGRVDVPGDRKAYGKFGTGSLVCFWRCPLSRPDAADRVVPVVDCRSAHCFRVLCLLLAVFP